MYDSELSDNIIKSRISHRQFEFPDFYRDVSRTPLLRLLDTIFNSKAVALLLKITRSDDIKISKLCQLNVSLQDKLQQKICTKLKIKYNE
jgi:hypothetical protein